MLSFPMYEDYRDNFVDRGNAPALPRRQPAGPESGADAEDFLRHVRPAAARDQRRRRRFHRACARRAGVGHVLSGAGRRRGDRPPDRAGRRSRPRRGKRGGAQLRLLAESLRRAIPASSAGPSPRTTTADRDRRVAGRLHRPRHRIGDECLRTGLAQGADDAELGRHGQPPQPVGERLRAHEAGRHPGSGARGAAAVLPRPPRAGSARVGVLQRDGLHARAVPEGDDEPAAGGPGAIADPRAADAAALAALRHRRRRPADRVRERREPAHRARDRAAERRSRCVSRSAPAAAASSASCSSRACCSRPSAARSASSFASWTTRFLLGFLPTSESPHVITGAMDWRVLGFNFALSLATGLLFGLVPAWRSTNPNLAPVLKDQAGSVVGGGVGFRKALVVAQVTISILLLISAGLFIRTLRNLRLLDLGTQDRQRRRVQHLARDQRLHAGAHSAVLQVARGAAARAAGRARRRIREHGSARGQRVGQHGHASKGTRHSRASR